MSEGPHEAERYRRRLYDAVEDGELSFEQKRDRLLAIGREYLGVENGHVERVDGDTHEIVASVGREAAFPVGAVVDGATRYCRRTVERDSALALSDAPEQGWADDPAYREQGMRCYLGAAIRADGETYGAVCFVSPEARESFDEAERSFVELVARLLGREIEAHAHEQALAERERRLAERERALERSERKYESLVRTAPDAILLVEADTGHIAEANEAAAALTGYGVDRLEGMAGLELHPPEDHDRVRALFERFVDGPHRTGRYPDGSPVLVRRTDGTDVPVEISATTVTLAGRDYVQAVMRDVSEHRERRRELRLKSRAIDEASVGITIADATDEDLPLVYANDEFERITGYGSTESLGRNCRFLQGEGTDEASVAELRAAIDADRPVTTELLNYRADGTPFWNELTLAPVGDGETTTHFVGFQRDVTARKRRERLLGVLNRVIRHDLRNGMTVVGGEAERLADRLDGDPAAAARRIADTAADLTATGETARTLERAVRDDADPEPTDLAGVVRAAGEDLRASFPEADVTVAAAGTPTVLATRWLRTALRELGENAIEHGCGAVRLVVPGEEPVVEVIDDGPGLPEPEMQVLRDGRETQLDHGSGLGLWLVNWVVTGAGGRFDVDATDGTTVALHLPPAGEEGRPHRGSAMSDRE